MNTAELLDRARSAGVEVWRAGEKLRYRGPPDAVAVLLPALRSHKPELLAALASAPELFEFMPPVDPEALEERACIIAEGCRMDYAQARQEARWQAERERAWCAFQCNARRILAVPEAQRPALLQRYEAEAASRYGGRVARDMAETMRRWVGRRLPA